MLNRIKRDKWKHFIVGVGMGLLFEALLFHFFSAFVWIGSVTVFLLIVFISYGFELLSLWLKKGHYDVGDAVAGAIGGLFGMAAILIFYSYKHREQTAHFKWSQPATTLPTVQSRVGSFIFNETLRLTIEKETAINDCHAPKATLKTINYQMAAKEQATAYLLRTHRIPLCSETTKRF